MTNKSKTSKNHMNSSLCSTPAMEIEADLCQSTQGEPKGDQSYAAMKRRLLHKNANLDWHLTEKDIHDHSYVFQQKKCVTSIPSLAQEYSKGCVNLVKSKCIAKNPKEFAESLFPVMKDIIKYNWTAFTRDLIAGVSVGISAIPMGMSYSILAGLPPAHGLYANIFFPLFYMFFGTSNQVCLGTSALEATMAAEAIHKLVGPNASIEEWLNASVGMTFFVGIFLILMRILNLGLITNFLADSILSGFSSGAAVTIASTQLRDVFGLPKHSRLNTLNTWLYTIKNLGQTNFVALGIFLGGICMLLLIQRLNKKYFKTIPLPGSLIMLASYLILHYFIDYEYYGVRIVGQIPAGLPSLKVFNFNSNLVSPLMMQALWYSLIYFVVHISIAKSLEREKVKSQINANQEFLATGLSSVFSSFFQCYPIATSVSRSSIAHTVGASTILYTIPNVSIVILTAAVITPFLYYLPIPALSAVIMFCAYGMICFDEAIVLFKLWNPDLILWCSTFLATVLIGSMEGVAVGLGTALIWILKKTAFPKVVTLGRISGTQIYKNIKRFSAANEIEGCKILRFDASLNFTNCALFESAVLKAAESRNESKSAQIKAIIIDASSIFDLDVTSIRMLKRLASELRNDYKILLFANWKGPMRDFLDRNRFYDVVPLEHCFLSLNDAVLWAELFHLNNTQENSASSHDSNYLHNEEITPVLTSIQVQIESIGTKQREWNTFNTQSYTPPQNL